jgi:hypothetical protein
VIKVARRGVVGDREIELAIIVKVEPCDAEAVIPLLIANARPLTDIGKGPVPIVAKEMIRRSFKTARPTITLCPRYWQ